MENSKIYSKIIYSTSFENDLTHWLERYDKRKIFLATEETVDNLWVNKKILFTQNYSIKKIVIPAGEENKKISSVIKLWEFLSTNGADRKSLLINIGGGMLTDISGFAASTFKRGINFINIPTTLLSQVDASVGGKTGFNFNGLKNEIGVFNEPDAVLINTQFLDTLSHENLLSGLAEMIKHGLIFSKDHLSELKTIDFSNINHSSLLKIISHSINIKTYFVANDPKEKNIRKALNFGHTFGHAFESLALEQNRPILHGYAVAWGMIAELYLSVYVCNFNQSECDTLTSWLLSIFGRFEITANDFQRILDLMFHDKKNEKNKINFTLLTKSGQFEINKNCSIQLIIKTLTNFIELNKKH